MSIQIDTVKSIGKSEGFSITPDDRQELVQLVDGVVAVDGWGGTRNTAGDVTGLSATFTAADASTVIGWWNSRTLKTVTLEDGTSFTARIVVRKITYPDAIPFRSKFAILDLEFWTV